MENTDKITDAANTIQSIAADGLEYYAQSYISESMNILRNDADEGLDIN